MVMEVGDDRFERPFFGLGKDGEGDPGIAALDKKWVLLLLERVMISHPDDPIIAFEHFCDLAVGEAKFFPKVFHHRLHYPQRLMADDAGWNQCRSFFLVLF